MRNLNINKKAFNKGIEIIDKEIDILINKKCLSEITRISNIADIDMHCLIKEMLVLGKAFSKYNDISKLTEEEIASLNYDILKYRAKEISFLENLEKMQKEVKQYLDNK